jgi:hypothetical protein
MQDHMGSLTRHSNAARKPIDTAATPVAKMKPLNLVGAKHPCGAICRVVNFIQVIRCIHIHIRSVCNRLIARGCAAGELPYAAQ